MARYNRRYANDEHRWDKFNDHRNEFRHLGDVKPPPKDHKQKPGEKPHMAKGKDGKKGKEAGKKGKEGGKHPTVKREHPSEHQRAQHAAEAHRGHAAHHGGGGRRR